MRKHIHKHNNSDEIGHWLRGSQPTCNPLRNVSLPLFLCWVYQLLGELWKHLYIWVKNCWINFARISLFPFCTYISDLLIVRMVNCSLYHEAVIHFVIGGFVGRERDGPYLGSVEGGMQEQKKGIQWSIWRLPKSSGKEMMVGLKKQTSDLWCFELTGFSEYLNVEMKKRQVQNNILSFGLKNWQGQCPHLLTCKDTAHSIFQNGCNNVFMLS